MTNEERRAQLEALRALEAQILAQNPLEGFHACETSCGVPGCLPREKQHEFMLADNKIVAAFAGNRFGKTTANVVWAIIQHTPLESLPERLRPFKRSKSKVTVGRYLTKNLKTFETVVIPELRKWIPDFLLRGGRWDKAYRTQHNILYFEDGGRLEFYSYDQDAAGMVGASLDYVIYDEPPPYTHFKENWIRTTDREGVHRIGLTPVNMQGADIAWIADLFEEGDEDPNVTLVRATIWDNPMLSRDEIRATLDRYPEDERQARETGELVMFGGLVYPGGFERHTKPEAEPDQLNGMDIVVGIDPGLKNAAFVWVAFDNDNIGFVFDEALIQEGTPLDYAATIREKNRKWHLRDPAFVIDPSARNRSLINAESVEAELARQGIYCDHGQHQVQAGVQSVRRRLKENGLYVGENCTFLRKEARKYRMEEGEEFKVVKEFDHHLDALRYALMSRPWYVTPEPESREIRWIPGEAPPQRWFNRPREAPPLGAMS